LPSAATRARALPPRSRKRGKCGRSTVASQKRQGSLNGIDFGVETSRADAEPLVLPAACLVDLGRRGKCGIAVWSAASSLDCNLLPLTLECGRVLATKDRDAKAGRGSSSTAIHNADDRLGSWSLESWLQRPALRRVCLFHKAKRAFPSSTRSLPSCFSILESLAGILRGASPRQRRLV